jgi:hypothetical protein
MAVLGLDAIDGWVPETLRQAALEHVDYGCET